MAEPNEWKPITARRVIKMEDFTTHIDVVFTEQRDLLGQDVNAIEKTMRQKEIIDRIRIVTANIHMAVRKNNLGSLLAGCDTEAIKILIEYTKNAKKMKLRAAYNICKDLLRFLEKDKSFKVDDFVKTYVIAVMVKLNVLKTYPHMKTLQDIMSEIKADAVKDAIFKLIDKLTQINCYSWKQYNFFPKCVSFRSNCNCFQGIDEIDDKKLENFLDCCYYFGFPQDQVKTFVNDKVFMDSLAEPSQMRLYSQKMMKNIDYNKQYYHMLAKMDDGPRNNITSLESKINDWIKELQSAHISSVEKSLAKNGSLPSAIIDNIRQIMEGDLSKIPADYMPQSLSQFLTCNDLKNMQEEKLKELFRNVLNTLPADNLKLLLEGVMKNLVTFSDNAKTTLELQVKCKLCLFFTREPEVLTEEGSEELMILFSFCLMEKKTKEKRKNENNQKSDYYLHYVTSDPDAILEKYQSCIDKLFKRSPPYCALFSDKNHGGKVLKLCKDKDFAIQGGDNRTKRRVDAKHILLLDTSFFDDRDLGSCLWKIWRDHQYPNTAEDILPLLRKKSPYLCDLQVDQQNWFLKTVQPLYESIAESNREPISELKNYIDKYGIKLGAASRFHESPTDFLSTPTIVQAKPEHPAIFAQNDQEFEARLKDRIKDEVAVKVVVIFPEKGSDEVHFEAIKNSIKDRRVTFYYGFPKPSTDLPKDCHVIQTYSLERNKLRKSPLGSYNFLINIDRLKNVESKYCMKKFIGSSKYYAAKWNNTPLWKMQIDTLLLLELPQTQMIIDNDALASNSVNAQVKTVDKGIELFYGFLTKKHAFMTKHLLPFNQLFTFENVSGVLKKVLEIRAEGKFDEGERDEGIIIATQADLLESWYNALEHKPETLHRSSYGYDVVFIHCSQFFEMIIDTREKDNEKKFIKRARVLEAVIEVHLEVHSMILNHFQRVVSVKNVVNIDIGDTMVQNKLEDFFKKHTKLVKIEFEPPKSQHFAKFFVREPYKKNVINTLEIAVERCVSLVNNSAFGKKDFITEIVKGNSTSFYKISGSESKCVAFLQSMLEKTDEKNRMIRFSFEDEYVNDACFYEKLSTKPLELIPIANICCGYNMRNLLKKDDGPKFKIWNGLENLMNLSIDSAERKKLICDSYKDLISLGVEDKQKAKICGGYETLFNIKLSNSQTKKICDGYDTLQNLRTCQTEKPKETSENITKCYFAVQEGEWTLDSRHYTAMRNILYKSYYSPEHSLVPSEKSPHEIVAKVYTQSTFGRKRSFSQ